MNAPATPSDASRGHKLLTRADLVALGIPAADVLQWLLAGSLCEAGSLPGDDGGGSVAVFAVPDPELRSELSERLTAIGRTDVALTRPQARAEVVRAVMAQRGLTPVETPLVEIEAGVEGEDDIEVEVADASASGDEDADFFDADALVQELDAWTEPEANDAELGEIEGESETMSATPDSLDTDATEAPEAESNTDTTASTANDATDKDGSATLLEDLAVAADEFETQDDDATDPGAADHTDESGTINAVADAAIDELVEPAADNRSKPTLDLPGFDSPAPDASADVPEETAPAAMDLATAAKAEAAADPEPAIDTTANADADADADLAVAAAELMTTTAESTTEDAEDTTVADDAETRLEAEADEPFTGEEALIEEPVVEPPVEETLPEEVERSLTEEPTGDEASAEAVLPEAVLPGEPEELPEAEAFADTASAEPVEEGSPVEEPASTEPAIAEAPAAAAMTEQPPEDSAPPPTATAAGASAGAVTTEETMTRVESFLGELRGALVDLAQRPPESAQPVDMQPLVAAVGEFGQRVEHGVAVGVHAAMVNGGKAAEAPAPIQYVKSASSGQEITMLSVAFLILCWSGILWFKTGNAVLAIGTLVGANVIGCCLLARRR